MTGKLSVNATGNQEKWFPMTEGKFHLQSVWLEGFVPYSQCAINVDEDGGRTESADDVERVPLTSTAGLWQITPTNGSVCHQNTTSPLHSK